MGLISPPKWPSVNPFSHPLGSKIGRKPMVNPSKWVNLKSNFLKFHHRNQAISGIEKAHRNSIKITVVLWRSERDLNSRAVLPAYSLSRGAPSASWVSLQVECREKNLAERVGFEPTAHCCVTGFQDRLFQPLRHLSRCLFISSTDKNYYSRTYTFCQHFF